MITIEQYQKINKIYEIFDESEIESEINKLLFSDIPINDLEDKNIDLIAYLTAEPEDIILSFFYKNIEYGIIPNFEKMKVSEYIDLENYLNDSQKHHLLMKILFRKIIERDGDYYKIEEYRGASSNEPDLFKELDFKYLKNALFFLKTLEICILKDLEKYTETLEMMNSKKLLKLQKHQQKN